MVEHAPLDRRTLLRAAAAAALPLAAGRLVHAQAKTPDSPFALGVASGSPADTSVVLWTRLMGGDGPLAEARTLSVEWEVAHDEAFARIARKGQSAAPAELAHAVHVEVDGLAPDRWYFYRFRFGDWQSPVGRTRTLPAPDAMPARLRLAYASCQRWEHGYYAAWRHLRQDEPDLVLFLGDYIYEYPSAFGAVRWPDGLWATSLEGYRRRHTLHKSDADLQAAHAACPWLLTWDDHEVQNDYAGTQPGSSGPVLPDFAERRAAAYQAYYEHLPLRASVLTRALAGLGEGAPWRLHSARRWGRLANLCLLDTRQFRSPQVCTPRGRYGGGMVDPADCPAWNEPARTLLGPAQEQWLDAQLAASQHGWTVLAQPTLFGQRDSRPGPGQSFWNDGWDGYPAARSRLVKSLQDRRAANPVIFGGDVHEHWVGHVKADYHRPESANVGVEFCGTSITSRTSGVPHVAERLAENPHFVYGEARYRGYGLAEFTPSRLHVAVKGLEDAERADSGIRTLASFTVAAGRPQLEKA